MLTLSSRMMTLRLPSGELAAQHGRRMSVISVAFTLKSVAQLAEALFQAGACSYITTYRLSQDHLELFFSCIRQRGGWNNNPSASQFRHAYRKLLIHAEVQAPSSANVAPTVEGIETLGHQGKPRREESAGEETPTAEVPAEDNICALLQCADHDYGESSRLSRFSEDIVAYIGGYVVRIVSSKLTCNGCLDTLLDDETSSVLIMLRDNGGLVKPSSFVTRLLCCAQQTFRLEKLRSVKLVVRVIVLKSFNHFILTHGDKLPLCQHYAEEPDHIISLAKVILQKYAGIRLREHSRRITEASRGAQVRQMLTKQILFRNQ
ncbi:uncharacterized protein LOC135370468 [Ornithodoros turicata]|uniref:uncharacterized protein LOC135370468 n=1 Tax=Ornithodoros turicata TaxID=34597 RepID=UPI0031392D03